MPVLAVIPARLAATRLPNKPLRLLGGLPLVVRVYERVMSLDIADACIVATDSDEVVQACADAGINAVLTSPDHPSGTDRVAEVASRTAFAEYNIIVNVQGDEPFVSRAAVAGAVSPGSWTPAMGNSLPSTVSVPEFSPQLKVAELPPPTPCPPPKQPAWT